MWQKIYRITISIRQKHYFSRRICTSSTPLLTPTHKPHPTSTLRFVYAFLIRCVLAFRISVLLNWWIINTLRPRQNGRHFPDDTFNRIFLKENVRISIKISLKFVSKGPIDNIPALFQIMAWRRPGDKPLSEPMMVILPTHICVTRPQWVNASQATHDPYTKSQTKPYAYL